MTRRRHALHSNVEALKQRAPLYKTRILDLFWSNWSLLSTSDCIEGDDIILENSCTLKAASGSNDCLFILVDLYSGKQTEMHFFSEAIALITLFILAVFVSKM